MNMSVDAFFLFILVSEDIHMFYCRNIGFDYRDLPQAPAGVLFISALNYLGSK